MMADMEIEDPQGKYILKYSYKDKIGEGQYSRVFKATLKYHHQQKELKVAAKVLKSDYSNLKYIKREKQMLSQIQHPNIIKFHQFLAHQNKYIYITQLCKTSLDKRMKDKNINSEDQHFKIYKSLLDALKYLHYDAVSQINQECITHRDIKPSNILFSFGGEVKLCDFGLAKIMERDFKNLRNTQQVGTSYYMSPSIIKGQPYNSMCDLWSLGIVIFEMINDCKALIPQTQAANQNIIQKQIKNLPKRISKIDFNAYKYGNIWKEAITNFIQENSDKRWTLIDAINSQFYKESLVEFQKSNKRKPKIVQKINNNNLVKQIFKMSNQNQNA